MKLRFFGVCYVHSMLKYILTISGEKTGGHAGEDAGGNAGEAAGASEAERIGAEEGERIGMKHALKKYDQFALNTSCFGEVQDQISITPVV